MKINLDLLSSLFTNSIIVDSLPPESETKQKKISQKPEYKSLKNFNFLNFWNRLIFAPECFSSGLKTPIHTIVEKEIAISSNEMISSVLSEKFGFPKNSITLSNAMEATRKIFHEDHPYDFVLEYNGERLGMVVLDFFSNSNEEALPLYRFYSHVKSFHGLY